MGALSLRLPESIHRHIREIAKQEGVSINQFISSAVSEKVSAILTEEYITWILHEMTLKMMYQPVSPIIAGPPSAQENVEFYHTGKCRYSPDSENASKQGFQQASGKPVK